MGSIGYCIRCQGLGYMAHFSHIAGGTCFGCNGDGLIAYLPKSVKKDGWEAASEEERIEFIESGLSWLRNGHNDHFVSRCRGWRTRTLKQIAAALKGASADLIEAVEFALLRCPKVTIKREWFAKRIEAAKAA